MSLYTGMPRKQLWSMVRTICDNYAYASQHTTLARRYPASLLLECGSVHEWFHRYGPKKMNACIRYYRRFYRIRNGGSRYANKR